MSVGVVIVNHNTSDDLLGCLDSLQTAGADQIVVVDSGSTDDSVARSRTAYPQVQVLAEPNLGFGKASNRGVAQLTTTHVVVANADVRFGAGSVQALGAFLDEHPDIGIAGPLVTHPDGRIQSSARLFPNLGMAVAHGALSLVWPTNPWSQAYRMTDWDKRSQRDVDWVSGCCLAVRGRTWEELGGFDPAYFMFVEDVDLCWRAHDAGWRVVFTPDATVTHSVGSAVGGRKAAMVRAHVRSLDYFVTNRYRYGIVKRNLIRAGMVGWAVSVLAWSTVTNRTHGQRG